MYMHFLVCVYLEGCCRWEWGKRGCTCSTFLTCHCRCKQIAMLLLIADRCAIVLYKTAIVPYFLYLAFPNQSQQCHICNTCILLFGEQYIVPFFLVFYMLGSSKPSENVASALLNVVLIREPTRNDFSS